jgi:hypothetical protein
MCAAVRASYQRRGATGWKQQPRPSTRFCIYKYGAKKRGIPFELTLEEFMGFWQQPCAYCGDPIEAVGLDRIESTKGYVNGNVVSCCAICNAWKNCLTVEEFRAHVQKVYAW